MKFPIKKYKKIVEFKEDYFSNLIKILTDTNYKKISLASLLIEKTIKSKNTIFTCGNGGSSLISQHYVVDYMKVLSQNTNLKPKIIDLSDNPALVSAVSNDINYDEIFKYKFCKLAKRGDILILISSSGNSKNIIKVLKYAKAKKIKTIGFTGFHGGFLKKNCDIPIHSNIENYGIVEDSHHIYMHVIMQYLKNKNLIKNIKSSQF